MSEQVQNSEFAQSPVDDDATSAHQRDIGSNEQTEIVQTTTPQELNTLANKAMNGDEDAFNQLFETFFSIATGYSYKLPEYIREEFLLDMGRRLVTCFTEKKWQDTGIPFEAWIHRTAHNDYMNGGEYTKSVQRKFRILNFRLKRSRILIAPF